MIRFGFIIIFRYVPETSDVSDSLNGLTSVNKPPRQVFPRVVYLVKMCLRSLLVHGSHLKQKKFVGTKSLGTKKFYKVYLVLTNHKV